MLKSHVLGKILFGVTVIVALAGCETTNGTRNKVRLDDSVVTAKVKEALAKDPTLGKYNLEVQTVSGEVVLRGHVDTSQDAYRAAEVVNKVEGVQSLLNMVSEK